MDISPTLLSHPQTKILPIDESFVRDPLLSMSSLNDTELAILNYMFKLSATYNNVYVSQATLGTWLGLTRRQINRVISKLTNLGLIAKIHRTYDTCIYLIADIFKRTNIKELLKRLLPNIVKLSFSVGQLLIPTFRKKKQTMDNNRTYSAAYHKPWVDGEDNRVPQKPRGFRSIGEIMDPTDNEKYKLDELEQTLHEAKEAKEQLEICSTAVNYLDQLSECADQMPEDKFREVLRAVSDNKTRVKVCRNWILGQQHKSGSK